MKNIRWFNCNTSFLFVLSCICKTHFTGLLRSNNTSFAYKWISQCWFSMINMCNDGHVTNISLLVHQGTNFVNSKINLETITISLILINIDVIYILPWSGIFIKKIKIFKWDGIYLFPDEKDVSEMRKIQNVKIRIKRNCIYNEARTVLHNYWDQRAKSKGQLKEGERERIGVLESSCNYKHRISSQDRPRKNNKKDREYNRLQ